MPEDEQGYLIRVEVPGATDFGQKCNSIVDGVTKVTEALGELGDVQKKISQQGPDKMDALSNEMASAFSKMRDKIAALKGEKRTDSDRIMDEVKRERREAARPKTKEEEKELEREAKAWQTYHKNVRKEESDRAKEHEKNLKNRERQEKEYLQRIGGKIAVFQTMMTRIGLGGMGSAMGRGAMNLATLATTLGLGTVGVGLGLGIGAIGAGGLAAGGMMLYGARQGLMRNPARQRELEMAQYVNPAEAMEKTRPLLKAEATWEQFKTKTYMWAANKVGDLAVNMAGGFMKTAAVLPGVMDKVAQTLTGGLYRPKDRGLSVAGVTAAVDMWKEDIKDKPSIGELRVWMDNARGALGAQGPTGDMAKMGLYATSSEAIRINRQDITQTEMINAMKELTKKMSDLADKGLFGDIGGGGKPITRT